MGRGRIVGVDFGTARVGLAVSDPLGLFAQPLGAFPPDDAIAEMDRIDRTDHAGPDRAGAA